MVYYVHNTSRSITNRVKRYEAASHRGLVQFLDGQRVIRGRPLALSEPSFIKNIDALKLAVAAGYLEVRTADGRVINLDTGEPGAAAASPPLPITVLDSVKNDPPSGAPMPIYPGGVVQLPTAAPEKVPSSAESAVGDDEDLDVEHTEAGSGIKRGGNKKGRR